MRRKSTKGMVVLLMLTAAWVYASPSFFVNNNGISLYNNSSSSNSKGHLRTENDLINGLINTHLANIADKFNKPNVKYAQTNDGYIKAKVFSKVVCSFLLVLTGFICISVVKDGRIWLETIYGLIWAGQIGSNIFHKYVIIKKFSTYFIHIKNSLTFIFSQRFRLLNLLYFEYFTRGPPNYASK